MKTLLTLALACLLVADVPEASAQWVNVAPGVDRKSETIAGPRRIRALRINLCQPGVRLRATTYAERGKITSTWASARGVVAATNGGYFLSGSYAPDAGAAWGDGTPWPNSTESGVRGWIAFGPRSWQHSPAPEIRTPPAWADEVINGDATLVSGGNVVNCGGCGSGRAPRTAIGVTADGTTLYLVVVDGRSTSSIGMTIDQLAVHMGTYGVHTAMNLDGGGSSTMWISGIGVVNSPSDGSQRTVGNHLGVHATGTGLAKHCPTGYAAEYVGSSFPGGLNLTLERGATASGYLEFRNIGGAPWDSITRLTPPKGQGSVLAHASWVAPERIAVPVGTVGANQIGRFHFTVSPPNAVGQYTLQMDMVQEFVTWFSDVDGPPAGQLATMTVNVVNRPNYRAQLVAIGGFPGNSTMITAETGAILSGWVDLKNTGAQTWAAENVKLGTTGPRDHASVLQAPNWLGGNRIVANASAVAPDQTVRYNFEIRVPDTGGLHTDTFGLVAESITWFADDGGPADNFLEFAITAVAPQPDPDPEPDVDTSEPPDTAMDDTEVVDPPDTVMTDSEITDDADDTDGPDTGDSDSGVQDAVAETVVGDTQEDTGIAEVTLPDTGPNTDTGTPDTAAPDTDPTTQAEAGRIGREARTTRQTLDDGGCSGSRSGVTNTGLVLLLLAFWALNRRRRSVTRVG